ncbi:MAG: peptidylprolyl isomerase [Bacteroidia bacterium]|nr:peptidylprolyl isomerase [Bacteroidia bacterium]
MFNRISLVLLLTIWGSLLKAQPKGAIIDQVVAVVGNNLILQSDIDNELQQLKSQNDSLNIDECVVLEELLFQKLLVHQAELDSVTVSESQIEAELDQRMRYYIAQAGSEKKLEEFMGKSIYELKNDYRDDLRKVLLAKTMQSKITQDVKVTPADVRSFFNSLPKDSIPMVNSEVEICQIVKYVPASEEAKEMVKEKLQKLRDRIVNGEDFAALAVLYSEDGSAPYGGELGFKSRNELVPEFSGAGFSLQGKEVSPVIETQYGYHIIQMIERRGEQANMRHILLIPKTSPSDLAKAFQYLDSVKTVIEKNKMDIKEAALKYSEDTETKYNGGTIINQNTGTTRFEADEMDATLFFTIDKLKVGELSSPVKFATRDGKQAYRLLYLKERTEPHRANLRDDYQKLQNVALVKKQQKVMEKWVEKRKALTYVKIDEEFRDCKLKYNWFDKPNK